MRRVLYGFSLIAVVAVIAVLCKAGFDPPPEKPSILELVKFYFCVAIALGTGALVFEMGKAMAGEKRQ